MMKDKLLSAKLKKHRKKWAKNIQFSIYLSCFNNYYDKNKQNLL